MRLNTLPLNTVRLNTVRLTATSLRVAGPSPALAAAVVSTGILIGWKGVDLPAQLYRVGSVRAHGLAIWDSQWFGGHWTLDYSVIFPVAAAAAGVWVVTVIAAAVAALAFERLATAHLGAGARPAAIVFALSTVVQSAIGQLPFLGGEALGLCVCWAASRNRWVASVALTLAASLTSPLAGAFVMVAMAGWALSRWPAGDRTRSLVRAAAVIVSGGAPIAAAAILFPGQGTMPYPGVDYAWEIAVAAVIWLLAGREQRVVRTAAVVFVAVATVAFVVPSPVGGNVGRIEDVLALPLAVAFVFPRRFRLALPLVAIPLLLSQWGPAWATITAGSGAPSTQRSYFAPLLAALSRAAASGPAGRVEVVPTKLHWESVFVAPALPLARGWERQLDESDNPLFYGAASHLDGASYRAWLVDNGVRWVALPDAPLDFAGTAEARLVAAGVAGLRPIWRSAHWRLYQVDGSSGIVAAPARLLTLDGSHLTVSTPRPGAVLVRVRYSSHWELSSGAGCIAAAPAPTGGTWIRVLAPAPEQFSLRLSLLPGPDSCSR